MSLGLDQLLPRIRSCRECEAHLPLGPRPVVRAEEGARILVVGQAPGTKVHESGVPWDDASGDHLREWLELDKEVFYDASRIAIAPMGFCYPGKRKGGDAPPRKECAPLWHAPLIDALPSLELIVLSGQYALAYYLRAGRKKNLTETVRAFRDHLPRYFALPHPSWRSKPWMKKNPWFETDVLPELRKRVKALL